VCVTLTTLPATAAEAGRQVSPPAGALRRFRKWDQSVFGALSMIWNMWVVERDHRRRSVGGV